MNEDAYEAALQAYKQANKKLDELKKQVIDAETEREAAFYTFKEEAKKANLW